MSDFHGSTPVYHSYSLNAAVSCADTLADVIGSFPAPA